LIRLQVKLTGSWAGHSHAGKSKDASDDAESHVGGRCWSLKIGFGFGDVVMC
jgi:hypothetical protein